MSHSLKCSRGCDILLDLFSSRVLMTCDMKTRLYQYSKVTAAAVPQNCRICSSTLTAPTFDNVQRSILMCDVINNAAHGHSTPRFI